MRFWVHVFAIGNYLYASGDPDRLAMAWRLTNVTVGSGYVLRKVTQQMWADSGSKVRAELNQGQG